MHPTRTMQIESHPRDRSPNDSRMAKLTLAGLTVFSVLAMVLILAVLFSPKACS